MILLFVIVIVVIGLVMMLSREDYTGGPRANYRTLATQYSNPLFSPGLSKRCGGGPYLYSSNPYLKSMCSTMTAMDLAETNCLKPGFNGRPIHFEYSQLSDGCWDNTICNTEDKPALCPCTL